MTIYVTNAFNLGMIDEDQFDLNLAFTRLEKDQILDILKEETVVYGFTNRVVGHCVGTHLGIDGHLGFQTRVELTVGDELILVQPVGKIEPSTDITSVTFSYASMEVQ